MMLRIGLTISLGKGPLQQFIKRQEMGKTMGETGNSVGVAAALAMTGSTIHQADSIDISAGASVDQAPSAENDYPPTPGHATKGPFSTRATGGTPCKD
jgi:hypothetical protein